MSDKTGPTLSSAPGLTAGCTRLDESPRERVISIIKR